MRMVPGFVAIGMFMLILHAVSHIHIQLPF